MCVHWLHGTALGLDILLHNSPRLCVHPNLLDDDTAALHHLPGLAIFVNLTQSHPLPQLLLVLHLEKFDLVLLTKSFNEPDVGCL